MKKSVYIVLAVMCFLPLSSFADTDISYFGFSYHMGAYDESGFPKANPTGFNIRGGKYVADNIAFEGRFTLGMASDTITWSGIDIDVKLKNIISAFVKADLPLSDSANAYALLGFSKGELEGSALGYTVSDSDSGLSYGVGAEVGVNNETFINAEYVMYLDESDYNYTGINIGISKLF